MDAEDGAICSLTTETSKLLAPTTIKATINCNNASNVGLLSEKAAAAPRLSLSESEEDVLNGNKSPVPGILAAADAPADAPESPKILEEEPAINAEAAIKQVDDTKNGNSPAKEGGWQQQQQQQGISLSSSLEEQLSSSAADDYKAHTSSFSFYDSSKLSASASSDDTSIALDSSLADFEDAALRYASLSMSRHNSSDGGGGVGNFTSARLYDNNDDSIFLVQSRGWLPMEKISIDPRANSANVEACIQHLSRSHGQILDGVGAWGHGKDMLLTIEEDHLKLLDPSTQVELHSQLIKHIKIWGVGHDNNSDFAFVAKDTADRSKPSSSYKCHVFRCEDCGPSIAEQLHLACTQLSKKAKQQKALADDNKEREKLALATPIPKPVLVAKDFSVMYLGSEKVDSFTGMDVVKDVIRNVTTNDVALCLDAVISVSNVAVVVKGTGDGKTIVHCRIRCLSFMGLGDDFSLFGFVSVVGSNGVCHVLQCLPTAFNLCLCVQEACCIRYQKAVDSSHDRPAPHEELSTSTVSRRFSFRRLMTSVFNGGRSAVRRTASSSTSKSNNGGSQQHLP